jgi:hypothetical protein
MIDNYGVASAAVILERQFPQINRWREGKYPMADVSVIIAETYRHDLLPRPLSLHLRLLGNYSGAGSRAVVRKADGELRGHTTARRRGNHQ